MDVKRLLHNNGSEILFRLKLDVLGGIVDSGNFHKDIADIKSLVSDLVEIIEKYETETLEVKAQGFCMKFSTRVCPSTAHPV